jgi:hypothetical protein
MSRRTARSGQPGVEVVIGATGTVVAGAHAPMPQKATAAVNDENLDLIGRKMTLGYSFAK